MRLCGRDSLPGACLLALVGAACSGNAHVGAGKHVDGTTVPPPAARATPDVPRSTPVTDPGEARIRELIAALDEGADPLHNDQTPAVQQLGKMGLRIIPHLRDALDAASSDRRLHAQKALEAALESHLGFVAGRGWTVVGGRTVSACCGRPTAATTSTGRSTRAGGRSRRGRPGT